MSEDNQRPAACSKCGAWFLPKQHVEWLSTEVKHDFYKCPACEHITTIWISDEELRALMKTQNSIKPSKKNSPKKQAIAKSCMRRVEDLKKEWLENYDI